MDDRPAQGRYILHADLDAFYASVEQRDDPTLRGKPVVVGGAPESRGVVAAASYEARRYGARSAMPMGAALRLDPSIVRVSPHFDRYREISRRIMSFFHELTSLVEPLSLDEAFMDITDTVASDQVEAVAQGLKSRVRQETGLAITIGGASSKTVAKVASQVGKPDGLLLVPPGDERAFLEPLDVGLLSGVGLVTLGLLKEKGVTTIGALASSDEEWLKRALGKRGLELQQRALGIDHSQVHTHRDVKSVSSETTFAQDIGDLESLLVILEEQVNDAVEHLRRRGLRGKTVKLKLRLADFTTFTRQQTLVTPTDDASVVLDVARRLLDREVQPGRRFRLIGAGLANLMTEEDIDPAQVSDAVQLPLIPLV